MTTSTQIGILGLGMHLPREVRRNDWWPDEVVATWSAPRPAMPPSGPLAPIVQTVVDAMRSQAADPFGGTVERHVLGRDEPLVDLERAAAEMAIERAGIPRGELDLVLTDTLAPPVLATNAACALHHRLGLRQDCFTLQTDGQQHAFILQLVLAQSMIAAGRARYALLVQSSAASRLLDYRTPVSAVFGDGATAAVVGPVAAGFGLLAASHRTDGAHPNSLIASVPGGAWYDNGRAYLHIADPAGMQDVMLRTVERSTESIAAALALAGLSPDDIAVFAMHQGLPWLRRLVQEHAQLRAARAVDTYSEAGHLYGACVPSTLAVAQDRGMLRAGDLVVLASGGNGMMYGAAVVRWGTA